MRAKKRFGQNFLRDERVIERIVDAADIREGDHILEIGPGDGALTAKMLERGAWVSSIEIDRDLTEFLRSRFANDERFQLVIGDALSLDLVQFGSGELKIVANLPYNISTPILQRFIEIKSELLLMVLMFQREVVERIAAPPGISDRGFLSVMVEDAFIVEKLFDIPPTAFSPVPKVWSSVARFTPRSDSYEAAANLRRLVSAAFAQKRKTLENNLKRLYPDLKEIAGSVGVDPRARAEALTLEQWRDLAAAIQAHRNQSR
ncbi:MAG: ribosomal RNA small subunit methyltransferase A [Acidobacteria bacterium]|nr:ribosomal RNA small subunit methyltransferase A [Acidobacteriota bacterium]